MSTNIMPRHSAGEYVNDALFWLEGLTDNSTSSVMELEAYLWQAIDCLQAAVKEVHLIE